MTKLQMLNTFGCLCGIVGVVLGIYLGNYILAGVNGVFAVLNYNLAVK